MKKLKLSLLKAVIAAFSCLVIFSSCKSLEQTIPSVDALSVLEEDCAIYFKIPVTKHADFAKKLLCSSVPGLSESNADYIIPKVNTICAGIGSVSSSNSSRIQISADGYIPPLAVKAALTEKNGWKLKKSSVSANLKGITVPYVCYERNDTDYKMGVCSLKNIVFSKDVTPLLSRYNSQVESLNDSGLLLKPSKNWVSNTYDWMTDTSDDIRFCVLYPQAFIKSLLGTEMNFAMMCARGSLFESGSGDFILSIELEFQNKLVITAAKAALSLVYGKSVSYETSSNILKVANIKINQEKIINLIGTNMVK